MDLVGAALKECPSDSAGVSNVSLARRVADLRSQFKALLQVDAQAVGEAVHEAVVSRDSANVVDRPVIETFRPQALDALSRAAARPLGELHRVLEHGAVSRGQRDLLVTGR